MAAQIAIWDQGDYDEYNRQIELIREAYPTLPRETCERYASIIVNNQKLL